MKEKFRFGIIGLGKMGLIRAREVERSPDAVLVSGADPDEGRRRAFHGISLHSDYRSLLADEPDVVVVCTPNVFTPDIVADALDAGCHVFCEKPPGRTVEDVERIVRAEARNPELKLKFGFNHRYHAAIREAKSVVDSGRLGEVMWLRGIYGKSGGADFEESWRSSREVCGGGILLDQGIHMIDLFRFFCGDFTEVKSMVSTAYWNIPVEDNAFALLRDASGRIALLHSSSTQWKHRFSFEVFATDGYVLVNGILSSTRSYGDESITVARKQFDDGFALGRPREEVVYFDKDPSWELELADFVHCIQYDEPVLSGTSADALAAMKLVYEIYESDSSWEQATQDKLDALHRFGTKTEGGREA